MPNPDSPSLHLCCPPSTSRHQPTWAWEHRSGHAIILHVPPSPWIFLQRHVQCLLQRPRLLQCRQWHLQGRLRYRSLTQLCLGCYYRHGHHGEGAAPALAWEVQTGHPTALLLLTEVWWRCLTLPCTDGSQKRGAQSTKRWTESYSLHVFTCLRCMIAYLWHQKYFDNNLVCF